MHVHQQTDRAGMGPTELMNHITMVSKTLTGQCALEIKPVQSVGELPLG